jgi:hypothetical protein
VKWQQRLPVGDTPPSQNGPALPVATCHLHSCGWTLSRNPAGGTWSGAGKWGRRGCSCYRLARAKIASTEKEAMRANVELSRDCHKAWCARLAWFLECIGVLSSEDICNPPDLDMVAYTALIWAGSCRQQLLHAGATVQYTYVQCFRSAPLSVSLDHIHICVLGCAFHIPWS